MTTREIIQKAAERHIDMAVLPISCLEDIKRDIEQVKMDNELNGFQKWITMEQYVLDPPQAPFPVRSLISLVAPNRLVRLRFHHAGRTASDVVEYLAIDPPAIVGEEVAKAGCHMQYVFWLPHKRIAVRAGQCEYGRNNITYSKAHGSLQALFVFVSDLPPEDYTWREVKNMDACERCGACVGACPTGAILPDRFLIDNERCLTRQNEWGTHAFPDWIPPAAHHRLTGCLKCQIVCPANKALFAAPMETVAFSEAETAYLLNPDKSAEPPDGLVERLKPYGIDYRMENLPRNLSAMLANGSDADV